MSFPFRQIPSFLNYFLSVFGDTFLERLYELHPIARGLSPEGHCAFKFKRADLPHETEYRV